MTHLKAKAIFACDFPGCHRVFPRKYNLQVHQRVHSTVCEFICTEEGCGRSFRWRSSLESHRLSHEREKIGGARTRRRVDRHGFVRGPVSSSSVVSPRRERVAMSREASEPTSPIRERKISTKLELMEQLFNSPSTSKVTADSISTEDLSLTSNVNVENVQEEAVSENDLRNFFEQFASDDDFPLGIPLAF